MPAFNCRPTGSWAFQHRLLFNEQRPQRPPQHRLEGCRNLAFPHRDRARFDPGQVPSSGPSLSPNVLMKLPLHFKQFIRVPPREPGQVPETAVAKSAHTKNIIVLKANSFSKTHRNYRSTRGRNQERVAQNRILDDSKDYCSTDLRNGDTVSAAHKAGGEHDHDLPNRVLCKC